MKLLFNIAGHLLSVDNRNDYSVAPLLNPYRPFFIGEQYGRQSGTVETIADIVIDDHAILDHSNDQIGRFNSGDNTNIVYALDGGGYALELCGTNGQVCAVMQADAAFRCVTVSLCCRQTALIAYALRSAIMMSYAFAAADRDTLLIHSSVIVNRGRAFLFLGKSGTGKSTHTRLWRENIPCSAILNDDNPVVRVIDGCAVVFGSPWSGKTPCYRNLSAAVGGITMLSQAPYNKMRRVPVIEGFADMMSSVSNMKWDRRINNGIISAIGHVLEGTQLYHLDCLPDADAVRLSFATMV